VAEVRCSECGFLALQTARNYEVVPAHRRYRLEGAVGRSETASRDDTRRLPICAIDRRDFADVYLSWPTHGSPEAPSPDEVRRLINEPIECDGGFYPWVPALTPKEHWDAKMMERRERFENEIRERRDKFEEDVRKEQRDWQQEQEHAAERRHDEQMDHVRAEASSASARHTEQMGQIRAEANEAKNRHRDGLIVFGLLIAVATVMGSWMEAGWWPQPGWFRWPF
jgi:hypothetical protein